MCVRVNVNADWVQLSTQGRRRHLRGLVVKLGLSTLNSVQWLAKINSLSTTTLYVVELTELNWNVRTVHDSIELGVKLSLENFRQVFESRSHSFFVCYRLRSIHLEWTFYLCSCRVTLLSFSLCIVCECPTVLTLERLKNVHTQKLNWSKLVALELTSFRSLFKSLGWKKMFCIRTRDRTNASRENHDEHELNAFRSQL